MKIAFDSIITEYKFCKQHIYRTVISCFQKKKKTYMKQYGGLLKYSALAHMYASHTDCRYIMVTHDISGCSPAIYVVPFILNDWIVANTSHQPRLGQSRLYTFQLNILYFRETKTCNCNLGHGI